MRKLISTLIIAIWLAGAIIGCASLQKGVDNANDYLARPATTQPGSPTNEQNIQAGAGAASVLGPYGVAAGVVLNAGLLLLHNLDSRNRSKKVLEAVEDAPAK